MCWYYSHGARCFLVPKSRVNYLAFKLHMMDLLFQRSALDFVLVTLNRSILCALAFPSKEKAGMCHRVLMVLLPARKLTMIKELLTSY